MGSIPAGATEGLGARTVAQSLGSFTVVQRANAYALCAPQVADYTRH